MENLNKQIKQSHTFRERLPFLQLIAFIERMVEFDWSVGRPAPNEVALTIAPHVFADAYKMKESGRKVLSSSDRQHFILPSEAFANLEKREINTALAFVNNLEFDSFEDYETARFKVRILLFLKFNNF